MSVLRLIWIIENQDAQDPRLQNFSSKCKVDDVAGDGDDDDVAHDGGQILTAN